jgi:3-deoxy-D-manno-octulosonic-acid transferase
LGETKALIPLIINLKQKVSISTMTDTGFNEAKKISSDVRYLPFEIFLPFWIKKHTKLIIMEAELWHFLILFAKLKGAKVYLLNARINKNSYNKYLKFKWFYNIIFNNIDIIFAQSSDDAQRLKKLGGKNIEITGNIKLATDIKIKYIYEKPKQLVVTAASTHETEEILILNAFNQLKQKSKLIIVPRHPNRFNKVVKLVEKFSKLNGYSYHQFSKKEDFDSDIVVVDKIGELINIYAISDIVILGGSFLKIGGHNPLEPAKFNCKIITGEYIFNQIPLFNLVSNVVFVKKHQLENRLNNHIKIKNTQINSTLDISHILNKIDG